jgi:hypothetical protein
MTPDERKALARQRRRELYQKMKERTAPARKAAYEKQKAYYKAKRAEQKAQDKAAKAAAKEAAKAERDEELRQALMPATKVERGERHLRLVETE